MSLRLLPRRRSARAVAAALVAAPMLAACGSTAAGAGTITLNWYNFPDHSGALQDAANSCSAASHGAYRINYIQLPSAADQQRQQLVRRLAAHDRSLDILGLDVTWEAEFSEAGWVLNWTGANKAAAEADTLPAALDTATWKGNLVAVPYNTNTQLLWYRSDLVPTPPTTWDQMIADAEQLAKQGKPHYIEIQGAQYEGLTVWFNTMISSAGGSVLTPDAKSVSLGQPAQIALTEMGKMARSPAADPSLSNQMEDQNRLAMEGGTAAFELNYPFVYPSMQMDNPKLFKVFKWTSYPEVVPGMPSKVTIGGIDLAISAYSRYPTQAFQAALCLRDRDNQKTAAVKGGLPPTLVSLYGDPAFQKAYPEGKAILAALKSASVRPKTPAYQNVSIVISHQLSPPSSINASSDVAALRSQLVPALQSKGLIP